MSSIEGDKATQEAPWDVLPQPQGSTCIPQHLPEGGQEEMLCSGYFQLLYSSFSKAA